VLQTLTRHLLAQGQRPALFFNRDGQAVYGRDRAVKRFYQNLKLPVRLGRSYFLQVEGDRRETWHRDYYDSQHQPVYPVPERLNTPALDLPLQPAASARSPLSIPR